MIHCDVVPRAGQRKAGSGNAGFSGFELPSTTNRSDPVCEGALRFFFFLGVCEELEDISNVAYSSTDRLHGLRSNPI